MGLAKNVFAFTAPGADYPEYLSINVVDGKVQFTVRGPKKLATTDRPYDDAGDTACMTLPQDQMVALACCIAALVTAAA